MIRFGILCSNPHNDTFYINSHVVCMLLQRTKELVFLQSNSWFDVCIWVEFKIFAVGRILSMELSFIQIYLSYAICTLNLDAGKYNHMLLHFVSESTDGHSYIQTCLEG